MLLLLKAGRAHWLVGAMLLLGVAAVLAGSASGVVPALTGGFPFAQLPLHAVLGALLPAAVSYADRLAFPAWTLLHTRSRFLRLLVPLLLVLAALLGAFIGAALGTVGLGDAAVSEASGGPQPFTTAVRDLFVSCAIYLVAARIRPGVLAGTLPIAYVFAAAMLSRDSHGQVQPWGWILLPAGWADVVVAAVLFAAATLLYGLLPRHPRPV